jgi:hypothetical protein
MCGTVVALTLQGYLNVQHPPIGDAELFFEEGDNGFGMIVSEMKRLGLREPIRRPGKPQPDKPHLRHYVHFQASDYLAFETRKIASMEKVRIRHNLAGLLFGIPGRAMKYEMEDLYRFCEKQKVLRISSV